MIKVLLWTGSLLLCLHDTLGENATAMSSQLFSHNVSVHESHHMTNESTPEVIEQRSRISRALVFPSVSHQHGTSTAFQNGAHSSSNHFTKGKGAYDHGLSSQKVFGNRQSSGSKESYSFHNSNSYDQGYGMGVYGAGHRHGHAIQGGHASHGHHHAQPQLVNNPPFGGCNLNELFKHYAGADGYVNQGGFAYNRGHSTSTGSGYRETFNNRENFGSTNQIGHQIGTSEHQNGASFNQGHHNTGMENTHSSSTVQHGIPSSSRSEDVHAETESTDLPPDAPRNGVINPSTKAIVPVTLSGPPRIPAPV